MLVDMTTKHGVFQFKSSRCEIYCDWWRYRWWARWLITHASIGRTRHSHYWKFFFAGVCVAVTWWGKEDTEAAGRTDREARAQARRVAQVEATARSGEAAHD